MALPLANDPITLLLDSVSHDLEIPMRHAAGLAAIAQGVKVRILLIAGEWFANLDAGIPWLERDGVPASNAILGQKFNEAKIRKELVDAALSVPGVLAIPKLDIVFDRVTRGVTVTWSVTTRFGDTPVDSLALGAS